MPVGVVNCEELNDIDAGLIDINELIEKLQVVRKKSLMSKKNNFIFFMILYNYFTFYICQFLFFY